MLERGALAQRSPAVPPAPAVIGTVAIRPLPAATRVSLRVTNVPAPAREAWPGASGLTLDLPINRFTAEGERMLARLGPDEWLAFGPEDDGALGGDLAAIAGARFHATVDVSHRSVGIEIAGAGAADALNAGCPLDLHARSFPVGTATRTLLGKAEIVLFRTGETTFRVECWRSFAAYAHEFLLQAAHDI